MLRRHNGCGLPGTAATTQCVAGRIPQHLQTYLSIWMLVTLQAPAHGPATEEGGCDDRVHAVQGDLSSKASTLS